MYSPMWNISGNNGRIPKKIFWEDTEYKGIIKPTTERKKKHLRWKILAHGSFKLNFEEIKAIPLKICFPHLEVTIVEPTLKRIKFLEMLINKLQLEHVTLINARAEDVASDLQEKFDICTARAVANTSILLELLVKMVKVNGKIVLYKGDKGLEEAKEATNACEVLNLQLKNAYNYQLSNNYGNRCILEYIKVKSTKEKYPRRYAEIKKKPL